MRKVIVIGIILASVLGAFTVWKFSAAEGALVKTVVVEQGPVSVFLTVTGKVISGHEVKLTSRVTGQVTEVYVKEGQSVATGKILARLDGREAAAQAGRAEAALKLAQAEVAQVVRSVERLRLLTPAGIEPRQKLEDAEAQLGSAQAKEGVAAADLRLAQVQLTKLNVVAPFDGLVTTNPARVGQWIVPPETLFTLADLGSREIEVKVDADDSASVVAGQEVMVSSDAFPGRQWPERVIRLAPAVEKEEAANIVNVRISLSRAAPSLRLGQQVDVKIRTAAKASTLKVPFGALINKDDKTWVAVIEQGRAKLLPVITGMEDLTHAEILQGLAQGQRVILPEGVTLNEGDRVRVVDGKPLPARH